MLNVKEYRYQNYCQSYFFSNSCLIVITNIISTAPLIMLWKLKIYILKGVNW